MKKNFSGNLCHFFRKRIIFCLGLFVLAASNIHAQTHGYGFVGGTFGDRAMGGAFRYGIGGSWAVAPHVTAGGEVGGIGSGLLASANAGVHLRRRAEQGFDPFFTIGITGVRSGGENGVYLNIGGGTNYWLHSRIGVRVEIRGYPGWRDLVGFSEIRAGICFR